VLQNMTPAIHLHLWTALPALVIGAFVLWRRKGTAVHKAMGRIWVVLMLTTAISSFWIRSMTGGFSGIHLLTVWTLFALALAFYFIRWRRNVFQHRAWMIGTYVGLLIAAGLTLLPDRRIHVLFFG
jgi:uncharacterized membrane protein